jgi:hypothetical protein
LVGWGRGGISGGEEGLYGVVVYAVAREKEDAWYQSSGAVTSMNQILAYSGGGGFGVVHIIFVT